MPELLPGAIFTGILTVVAVIILRARATKPRLSLWKLALIGVAAAYGIPPILAFLEGAWRATPWLPDLPVITSGQVFIAAWTTAVALTLTHRPGNPPRVPIWAGLLIGVVVATVLPQFLDRVTGSYQSASLRADLNHCTRGMMGQAQPGEVMNICDEPIVVGLCMPDERNPTPCAQAAMVEPGQVVTLDPGEARLSSLPSNPGGLTVVACRPPDRPSRRVSTIGRGYEGVCLPPA